jgi:tetratricopeptide (TPR) repeat protein
VGPVQPLDPKLAWDEALAVLPLYHPLSPGTNRRKAPPHWSQLVAGHESIVAIAFSAGNFPQLMRNFHTILTQPNLVEMRPTGGQPAAASDLRGWADDIAAKKQYPEMLLALGAFRLARQFDEADKFVNAHDANIPSEWRAGWENEKAALAWHSGRCEEARQMWRALEPTAPVLFNRGMSALFAHDFTDAKQQLTAAIAQLPASSAWHHLGRLYLTLTELRKS